MKKYSGGCHCGKVRFEIEAGLEPVIECNCSICSKKGYLLAFEPESRFALMQGQDALQEYQFNKKVIQHFFCRHCGVGVYGKGQQGDVVTVAINVRCLDDIDLGALKKTPYDGKNA